MQGTIQLCVIFAAHKHPTKIIWELRAERSIPARLFKSTNKGWGDGGQLVFGEAPVTVQSREN